jgi:molecular chaperone DnaK
LLEKLLIENPEAGDLMADPETRAALITTVEKTKMSLSQKETATARITCCDGRISKVSVTREEFNEATQPLLNRTIEFTDAMIAMAREKTGVEKIDEFLLVGGSTYMPQVMEMVNSRYKDTLRVEPKLYEPNYAVSKGAALYGNNKAIRDLYEKVLKGLKEANPNTPTEELKDKANDQVADGVSLPPETVKRVLGTEMITVASKSIGIRVKNKEGKFVCYNLIEKQTEVPCSITRSFPVSEANAAILPLIVYSNNMVGEQQVDLDYCLELGKATMELTPGLPAGAPIEVTFALDPEGRLELTARDVTNDKKIVVPFQVEGVLSEEERKKLEKVVADLKVAD